MYSTTRTLHIRIDGPVQFDSSVNRNLQSKSGLNPLLTTKITPSSLSEIGIRRRYRKSLTSKAVTGSDPGGTVVKFLSHTSPLFETVRCTKTNERTKIPAYKKVSRIIAINVYSSKCYLFPHSYIKNFTPKFLSALLSLRGSERGRSVTPSF